MDPESGKQLIKDIWRDSWRSLNKDCVVGTAVLISWMCDGLVGNVLALRRYLRKYFSALVSAMFSQMVQQNAHTQSEQIFFEGGAMGKYPPRDCLGKH